MKISTRGRYAVRIMVELASLPTDQFFSLKDLAQKQEIPFKYIEKVVSLLVKKNLIEARSGKGGGYRLTKDPSLYTVGEILRITEGDLNPVACLSCNGFNCKRKDICTTLPMWKEFEKVINDFFDSRTLSDLTSSDSKLCGIVQE